MIEEAQLAPAMEWEPPCGCWVFLRADGGPGYWLGPEGPLEIAPGSAVLLPPTRSGVLRASRLAPFRAQWFRFCPDLMGGVLTMSELHLFRKQRPSVRIFPRDHPVAKAFHNLDLPPGVQNGFLTRGRMIEMIGLAFGCDLVRNSAVEGSVLSAAKRIKLLMNHLTEEEFIRTSVEELAGSCGCSVRHFNRLFRHEFGISLRERQTESRLGKASRLLAETDSRVTKVAVDCGYRHLGVFNSLFKQRFGLTPTEWRRRRMGEAEINGCADTATKSETSHSNSNAELDESDARYLPASES